MVVLAEPLLVELHQIAALGDEFQPLEQRFRDVAGVGGRRLAPRA